MKNDYFPLKSCTNRLATNFTPIMDIFSNENHYHCQLFQVRVVAADFTGSIQTVDQLMTRSKLFATWRLSVEVGP